MNINKHYEVIKSIFTAIGLIFVLYKIFTFDGFTSSSFEIKVENTEEKELVLLEKRFFSKNKVYKMELIANEWKWQSAHSKKWYDMPEEVHLSSCVSY